jgi:hypothetical protein
MPPRAPSAGAGHRGRVLVRLCVMSGRLAPRNVELVCVAEITVSVCWRPALETFNAVYGMRSRITRELTGVRSVLCVVCTVRAVLS